MATRLTQSDATSMLAEVTFPLTAAGVSDAAAWTVAHDFDGWRITGPRGPIVTGLTGAEMSLLLRTAPALLRQLG